MATIYEFDRQATPRELVGAAYAFGVFDGVHRGHRYLIEGMMKRAEDDNVPSAVLTFSRDPDELFRPRELMKLDSNEQRIELLASLGVDAVVVIPFDEETASVSADDFLCDYLGGLQPSSLHVGYDFRFGARAMGTVCDLCKWGEKHDMNVESYPLLKLHGAPVSATRIRNLYAEGKDEEARYLLGQSGNVSELERIKRLRWEYVPAAGVDC